MIATRNGSHSIIISALYGLIWGIGPFLLLPEISDTSVGLLPVIIIFGTIMGPYAAMPGILYARLVTTWVPALVAIALYTDRRTHGRLHRPEHLARAAHRRLARLPSQSMSPNGAARGAGEAAKKLQEANRANEDLKVMAATAPSPELRTAANSWAA